MIRIKKSNKVVLKVAFYHAYEVEKKSVDIEIYTNKTDMKHLMKCVVSYYSNPKNKRHTPGLEIVRIVSITPIEIYL